MANKKNDVIEDVNNPEQGIPAAIGEEADDLSDLLPKADGITPISIASKEEIAKLPEITIELTANAVANRTTKVVRRDYTATLLFSYLTKYTFHLDDAEYGLICEELGKDYTPAQFRFKGRARIVGTVLEDGTVFYRLDAVLSDSIRKSVPLANDGAFMKLFLKQVESGKIEGIKPEMRKALPRN